VKGVLITMRSTQDVPAPVPLGTWLQAEVDLPRRTRTTMFAQGVFSARGEAATRAASGLFRLPRPDG
jgi:hypothetical protein